MTMVADKSRVTRKGRVTLKGWVTRKGSAADKGRTADKGSAGRGERAVIWIFLAGWEHLSVAHTLPGTVMAAAAKK